MAPGSTCKARIVTPATDDDFASQTTAESGLSVISPSESFQSNTSLTGCDFEALPLDELSFGDPYHLHPKYQVRFTNTENVIFSEVYQGPSAEYVGWGKIKVASIHQPLGTDGLWGCSALIMINKKRGIHALGHAYPTSGFENFGEEIGKIPTRDPGLEVYVLPGAGPIGVGLSIYVIFAHLASIDPSLTNIARRLYPADVQLGTRHNVVIHEGSIFKKFP